MKNVKSRRVVSFVLLLVLILTTVVGTISVNAQNLINTYQGRTYEDDNLDELKEKLVADGYISLKESEYATELSKNSEFTYFANVLSEDYEVYVSKEDLDSYVETKDCSSLNNTSVLVSTYVPDENIDDNSSIDAENTITTEPTEEEVEEDKSNLISDYMGQEDLSVKKTVEGFSFKTFIPFLIMVCLVVLVYCILFVFPSRKDKNKSS